MIKEFFCLLVVCITSVIPNSKAHEFASNLIERTFVISEVRDDGMSSQAVKVFSNSEALKDLIVDEKKNNS